MSRAFFRMDAGRFMKKFFFMFFLIWIKKFKNSLLFGGIQTTSSLVDYLSAFSGKGDLLLKGKAIF